MQLAIVANFTRPGGKQIIGDLWSDDFGSDYVKIKSDCKYYHFIRLLHTSEVFEGIAATN